MKRLIPAAVCALFLASAGNALAQNYSNVILLANEAGKPAYNDCWGYAAGGQEYAIIGYSTGTLFYRVTDPNNPVLVGDIGGVGSTWRDMKTNGTYCYIVTEGGGGGLQIVDLTDPDNPSLVNTYNGFSTAHNIYIEEATDRAYIVGSNLSTGGMRILDIGTDPVNPVEVGSWETRYIHDVYVRNDTAYAGCISNNEFRILDVSNPASVVNLATQSYGQSSHATWLLDNTSGYMLSADEQSGGWVRTWDISNLASISQVSDFRVGTGAGISVHNVFVKNDTMYASYYTEGLRVVDFTNPLSPTEVGFWDTWAGGGLFDGLWGTYPYLPSGTIIGSDFATGMYLWRFEEGAGEIAGTVTDTSGAAVPGRVIIDGEGLNDSTDVNGDYAVQAGTGTKSVIARGFGYESDTASVAIVSGTTVTQDFILVPLPTSTVSGTVTSAGPDTAVANAKVEILGQPREDLTDALGDYALTAVPGGSYTIAATAFGFDSDTVQLNVTAGVPETLDFSLIPWFLALDMSNPGPFTVDDEATDGATTGIWEKVNPRGTAAQPEDDHSETNAQCYVTGQTPVNGGLGDNDVDGGKTSLYTGIYDVTSLTNPEIIYYRWFVNDAGGAPSTDPWVVSISNDSGQTWTDVENTLASDASWTEIRFLISDFVAPSNGIKMRFVARDDGAGSIVEAGIDDFGIRGEVTVSTDVATGDELVPTRIVLEQNSPNPFNPTTSIRFSLPSAGEVELAVFDLAGRRVRTLEQGLMNEGAHTVTWNGRSDSDHEVASGIYFYKLTSGKTKQERKMVLIR